MLLLFATPLTPPISVSVSPDYINDGLQAAYVILTLIIVITTFWSIHMNRKQSQAALEESRKQSQEVLKITNAQITKNEQQAKASLEAIYKQIELSEKQAQEAFYNQIRPILICTGQPRENFVKIENVGFGVATDVWGIYCIPCFSLSFSQSIIVLPNKEVKVTLLHDHFMYNSSAKIEGYSFYPQENHGISYQSRMLVTYSDAFNNRYLSIFDYNKEYGWKQIASQKTKKTLDELIISERLETQQIQEAEEEEYLRKQALEETEQRGELEDQEYQEYQEAQIEEYLREEALEEAAEWVELEHKESLNEKVIEMTTQKN
jgi:hypothetical protein